LAVEGIEDICPVDGLYAGGKVGLAATSATCAMFACSSGQSQDRHLHAYSPIGVLVKSIMASASSKSLPGQVASRHLCWLANLLTLPTETALRRIWATV
jgi:hypothetical protein